MFSRTRRRVTDVCPCGCRHVADVRPFLHGHADASPTYARFGWTRRRVPKFPLFLDDTQTRRRRMPVPLDTPTCRTRPSDGHADAPRTYAASTDFLQFRGVCSVCFWPRALLVAMERRRRCRLMVLPDECATRRPLQGLGLGLRGPQTLRCGSSSHPKPHIPKAPGSLRFGLADLSRQPYIRPPSSMAGL